MAKLWNQPRCPSTDEWITKLWEIYTMESYSAIKKNKITSFARKWKDLENIMLSETSQSKREGSYFFINMCNLGSSGDTQGTPVDNGEPSVGQGKWYKGRGRARKKRISGITIINNMYM